MQGQLFDVNGLYPGLKLATTLALETEGGNLSTSSSSGVEGCVEVAGEVWKIRDFTEGRAKIFMEALDEYEECAATDPKPHPYRRTITKVALKDLQDVSLVGTSEPPSTSLVQAWVYEYILPVEEQRRIASGDWLQHIQGQDQR